MWMRSQVWSRGGPTLSSIRAAALERCPLRKPSNPHVHYEKCTMPPDRYTVTCVFAAGHGGDEHAALVGIFRDPSKEPYLYWRPGIPGAREIRQPGLCARLDQSEPTGEVFCLLPGDHPGDCAPNM